MKSEVLIVFDPSEDSPDHEITIATPPGDYQVWAGYQSLLGSRVGKLILTKAGLWCSLEELVGKPPSGNHRFADFSGLVTICEPSKVRGTEEDEYETLFDTLRAAVSTNELAGVVGCEFVVTTTCLSHLVSWTLLDDAVYFDFAVGM